MKVRKTEIPTASLVNRYCPADYYDSFVCDVDCSSVINPDDIMVRFWTDFPNWVALLFKIRNILVRFVGLKGAEDENLKEFENCIRSGGKFGLASVPAKNEKETVVLLTDKHLDAYMSVYIEGNRSVYSITVVHFKNKLGRIYFFFIRPFHGLIVRSLLKRALRGM